jgi:phage anti-repressor protein
LLGWDKKGSFGSPYPWKRSSNLLYSTAQRLEVLPVVFHSKETIMHNQELIPVFTGTIAGVPAQLVDARTLHAFLEVGKVFATWMTDRIKQYDFLENQDFIAISQNREIGKGRGKNEYHLTLDMAKELSMVERNPKGKEARCYFIECEKRLLGQVPAHVAKAYDELVANKIPEYLKIITAPLPVAEFEERYHFHENALKDLKNAQIIMSAREFLNIKHKMNEAKAN